MSTIIYKVPGPHRGPKGTSYDYRSAVAGDKVPEGWHACLADAVEEHLNPKPKRKRRTKAEIEASKAENS